jgi:hypothetical protein
MSTNPLHDRSIALARKARRMIDATGHAVLVRRDTGRCRCLPIDVPAVGTLIGVFDARADVNTIYEAIFATLVEHGELR